MRPLTNPLFVLLAASCGCAMTVLDTNIVAIVLPTLARRLNADFADIQWVISTYVLCFAALLLPAGAIADRYGRRRIFLGGIAGFAFASLLCGLASSAPALYLARAAQGVGAAFLLAPALAIIGHTFHDESARARAWTIWGGMMGLTMVLAPILGGLVTFALGWRWAFFINLPVCAALAIAVLRLIPESCDAAARRLDPPGILSFAATMFGLTWGIIETQAQGLVSAPALTGFAGGFTALAVFLVVENRQARPMLDLSLFRVRRFIGAVLAMFAYAATAQVMAQLLPLYLQNALGRAPLEAGFSMLPFALTMLILPEVGRRLDPYVSSVHILSLGLAITGLGDLLLSFAASGNDWTLVALAMAVLGSGGGLLNGETQKAIVGAVPRDRAGMASGISTTAADSDEDAHPFRFDGARDSDMMSPIWHRLAG
ncbi:MAG TPA: MFS transporter [Acidocella sp.]|nr:MFS transporter [Acidocella sp.]